MTIFVMLDLETWGKRPGCDIRSIGACVFDPETGRVGAEPAPGGCNPFYIACDNPVVATRPGMDGDTPIYKYPLTRDPDTVQWWSEQSDEAQAAFGDAVDLLEGLSRFTHWLADISRDIRLHQNDENGVMPHIGKWDGLRIWAHGPQFDISILEAAYHAVGLPVPWHYRAPRDTRTILEAAGIDPHKGLEMFSYGTAHHALDDAICQARAVCAAYKVLRSRPARQSSPALSTLAARVLHLGATGTPEYNALLLTAKRLAGSVLSQDETPAP